MSVAIWRYMHEYDGPTTKKHARSRPAKNVVFPMAGSIKTTLAWHERRNPGLHAPLDARACDGPVA